MKLMRRPCAAVVSSLACLLVAATSADGKEGVRATLEYPALLTRAAPGEHVRIAWELNEAPRLPIRGALPRERPVPFGATGVYVRVTGAAGGTPADFPARSPAHPGFGYPRGRYVADVMVPQGGIASLTIGLEGFRYVRGEAPVRSDVFFPIDNDPFAAGRATASADAGDGLSPPWGLLAAGLAALAVLGGLLAARRAVT